MPAYHWCHQCDRPLVPGENVTWVPVPHRRQPGTYHLPQCSGCSGTVPAVGNCIAAAGNCYAAAAKGHAAAGKGHVVAAAQQFNAMSAIVHPAQQVAQRRQPQDLTQRVTLLESRVGVLIDRMRTVEATTKRMVNQQSAALQLVSHFQRGAVATIPSSNASAPISAAQSNAAASSSASAAALNASAPTAQSNAAASDTIAAEPSAPAPIQNSTAAAPNTTAGQAATIAPVTEQVPEPQAAANAAAPQTTHIQSTDTPPDRQAYAKRTNKIFDSASPAAGARPATATEAAPPPLVATPGEAPSSEAPSSEAPCQPAALVNPSDVQPHLPPMMPRSNRDAPQQNAADSASNHRNPGSDWRWNGDQASWDQGSWDQASWDQAWWNRYAELQVEQARYTADQAWQTRCEAWWTDGNWNVNTDGVGSQPPHTEYPLPDGESIQPPHTEYPLPDEAS